MNVKLLRKVQKQILEDPRRFAMSAWHSTGIPGHKFSGMPGYNAGNPYEKGQRFPPCGTIACIGGWARVFDPEDKYDFDSWAGRLIDADDWPRKFRDRYSKAKTPKTRAKIAAERIDHFIATKGDE